MKRVLLTGASGFVGRHCIPILKMQGFEVHAADMRILPNDEENVIWHQVNLLDFREVDALFSVVEPSHFLHLAWDAQPGSYWTSLKNIEWVKASLHLLQLFHQHGGARVVMAGTCAEYDWRFGYCSEALTPLNPTTLYGTSKQALGALVGAYSKQTGLSSAWGRIFFMYGPHEHPQRLVSSVILNLLQNKPALCSHGNQIRDFLHVEDVAKAFVMLLESDVTGPVNVASGNPVKIKEIINLIGEELESTNKIKLGALPVSDAEPQLLIGDIRRLKDEIQWSPTYDIYQGIKNTIAWWKLQKKQGCLDNYQM